MTKQQIQTIYDMREQGHMVLVIPAPTLRGVDPWALHDTLEREAHYVIEDLGTPEGEEE